MEGVLDATRFVAGEVEEADVSVHGTAAVAEVVSHIGVTSRRRTGHAEEEDRAAPGNRVGTDNRVGTRVVDGNTGLGSLVVDVVVVEAEAEDAKSGEQVLEAVEAVEVHSKTMVDYCCYHCSLH